MKTKFYKKWWFYAIILLILFLFCGIIGILQEEALKRTQPIMSSETQTEISTDFTTDNATEKSTVDISSVDYEVAFIDNSNLGNVIRETLHIIVSGKFTKEQLFEIAKIEAQKYTSTNKVNALKIGFYDPDVLSNKTLGRWYHSGFTYGFVDYVPNGVWGDAMNVKAGDYTNFEYVNGLYDFKFDTDDN